MTQSRAKCQCQAKAALAIWVHIGLSPARELTPDRRWERVAGLTWRRATGVLGGINEIFVMGKVLTRLTAESPHEKP